MESRDLNHAVLPPEACKVPHHIGNHLFPFVCGLCNLAFRNLHCFYTHFQEHHELLGDNFYHLCKFSHSKTGQNDDRNTTELRLNILSCNKCSQTFGTICAIQMHIFECHKSKMYLVDLERHTVFPQVDVSKENTDQNDSTPAKRADSVNHSISSIETLANKSKGVDNHETTSLGTIIRDATERTDSEALTNDINNTNDGDTMDITLNDTINTTEQEKEDTETLLNDRPKANSQVEESQMVGTREQKLTDSGIEMNKDKRATIEILPLGSRDITCANADTVQTNVHMSSSLDINHSQNQTSVRRDINILVNRVNDGHSNVVTVANEDTGFGMKSTSCNQQGTLLDTLSSAQTEKQKDTCARGKELENGQKTTDINPNESLREHSVGIRGRCLRVDLGRRCDPHLDSVGVQNKGVESSLNIANMADSEQHYPRCLEDAEDRNGDENSKHCKGFSESDISKASKKLDSDPKKDNAVRKHSTIIEENPCHSGALDIAGLETQDKHSSGPSAETIKTVRESIPAASGTGQTSSLNKGDCIELDEWTCQFYETESDSEPDSPVEMTLSQGTESCTQQVPSKDDAVGVMDEITIDTILQDIKQSELSDDESEIDIGSDDDPTFKPTPDDSDETDVDIKERAEEPVVSEQLKLIESRHLEEEQIVSMHDKGLEPGTIPSRYTLEPIVPVCAEKGIGSQDVPNPPKTPAIKAALVVNRPVCQQYNQSVKRLTGAMTKRVEDKMVDTDIDSSGRESSFDESVADQYLEDDSHMSDEESPDDDADKDFVPSESSEESDDSCMADDYEECETEDDEINDIKRATNDIKRPTNDVKTATNYIETAINSDICESSGDECNSEIVPMLGTEESITLQKSKENSKGNLNNKKHACLYCDKILPNIARHYGNKHSDKHEVAKVLLLPKGSAARRKAWIPITNKGDFNHNYDVYEKGQGMLIPKYRSKSKPNVGIYVPCVFCKGLYVKTDLWKHQKVCGGKIVLSGFESIRSGKLILPRGKATTLLYKNVLSKMKDDEIKTAVLSDEAIIAYGNSEYQEKSHLSQHRGYVSNRMRELGRLLISAKHIDQTIKSITDLMINKNWDLLVKATQEVSKFDEDTRTYGIPLLPEKLGQHMKTLAEIIRFEAEKDGKMETIALMDTFVELYQRGWNTFVSFNARSNLKKQKSNKPCLLSLVEDAVNLNIFLDEQVDNHIEEVKTDPSNFANLAKMLLAKVILFNLKRSGEAERMTLRQFEDAKLGFIQDPVLKSTLSKFEQRLCASHVRVEIRGRKGMKVPVLLTDRMVQCLNTLLQRRMTSGVSGRGFVFARPGEANTPYRGCDVLREASLNCPDCRQPENINSTKFRKQLATCVQILNTRDFEQDLLATFQCHDVRISREFNRLSESPLQIAKITKVLHSLNNRTINKFAGCNFEDIEFEEKETVEDESDDDCDDGDDDEGAVLEQPMDVDMSDSIPASEKKNKMKRKSYRKGSKKKPWSSKEKQTLIREFSHFIKEEKVPGKPDILKIANKNKVFIYMDWKRIKYAVYNVIVSRQRKKELLSQGKSRSMKQH